MVYLLEHSDVLAGEHDTSNSAGIGIWTASDQGIYGVASQDLGVLDTITLLFACIQSELLSGYYIDIYLGSPSTKFQVQLDTASADTWVASTACTDCGINYGRRAALGADNSQSLVANTSQWTASYSPSYPLTGIDLPLATVEGTGAQDLLIFGGGLSTENFPFGLATGVSDTFSADEM